MKIKEIPQSERPYEKLEMYGEEFGLSTPVTLDLNIIKLTIGCMFKINISSIIGLILAIYIYRKV